MKTYNSKTVIINKPKEELYAFLSDFNNFESLMPPEVVDWHSDTNSCGFTISGLAKLNMVFGNSVSGEKIEIVSKGDNPFHYTLTVFLKDADGEATAVSSRFDADLNMMMAMVAGRHLEKFVNMLVDKLAEIHS